MTDDKRECASCGRSEPVDALKLCKQCRSEYDAETAEWERMEQLDEDLAQVRAFYNG
jgi:uncharacterized membrane protein YvbJ